MRAALMEYTTASQTAQPQTVLKFQTGAVDTAVRTAGRAGAVKHPYAHHNLQSSCEGSGSAWGCFIELNWTAVHPPLETL